MSSVKVHHTSARVFEGLDNWDSDLWHACTPKTDIRRGYNIEYKWITQLSPSYHWLLMLNVERNGVSYVGRDSVW